jgi:endoglucanase
MKYTFLISLFVATQSLLAQDLHINQIGFKPKSNKVLVFKDLPKELNTFEIKDALKGKVVFKGKINPSKTWEYSNENLSIVDFSSLALEGKYTLCIGKKTFKEFTIANSAYDDILKASCKAFYLNRASMDIEAKYAGEYARIGGHLDNKVKIHPTAYSEGRDSTTRLNSPGGWYDAGDYNKYIVNSGISTYTLLRAYDKFNNVFETLDLNIPESSNKQADLLDEIEYNINWMLTMQDPKDGGVYHKLTELRFSAFVQPNTITTDRYVTMKTTSASLDFAAVLAYYARLIKDENRKKEILALATKAYNWSLNNPALYYEQAPDINTGQYEDQNVSDEWVWASAEMFLATGLDTYAEKIKGDLSIRGEANWNYVKPLALFSLAANKNQFQIEAQKQLKVIADNFLKSYETSANKTVMGVQKGDFTWGSNAVAANQSMLLIEVSYFDTNPKLLDAAWSNIHYLMGQNPLDYCYVTGFGTKSPMHIHHRLSSSDGVVAPQPGLLAGGPNFSQQDKKQDITYPSDLPAMSYTDEEPSYASNEIAINWNAPLVYVLAFAKASK